MCYQAFGDARLLDPIVRGMNAFIVTQLGPPQPGWGLQHTLDLQPSGARTYEPKALVTHTTANNIDAADAVLSTDRRNEVPRADSGGARLAGEADAAARRCARRAARIRRSSSSAPTSRSTCIAKDPTCSTAATYVDKNPKGTIVALQLVPQHRRGRPAQAVRGGEEHAARRGDQDLAAEAAAPARCRCRSTTRSPVAQVMPPRSSPILNAQGYWLAPLGNNSHPYKADGSKAPQPGDLFADLRR